jgi:hypothetical protein
MSTVLTGNIVDTLQEKFGREAVIPEETKDGIPTFSSQATLHRFFSDWNC